jgi:hypothetical protein
MRCEECGVQDETVREVHCPYAEELTGELVPASLCAKCLRERVRDV